MDVSQRSHGAFVVAKPIFFLFPALPSCPFNCYYHPVSSDFSFSVFLSKNALSSQSCKLFFPSPRFTPQLYCHLLNCRTDLLFDRSNLILTNSLQSLSQSFTFCFSLSSWLYDVSCSSQELLLAFWSVCLALMVLFSDSHHVLSKPPFSPDADLLWAHGPNLHRGSSPCKHITDKMLPGVSGSKLQTSPWSGFYKKQIKSQNH